MKRLFGTDGIRGEAGVFPLDEATVRVIGGSLAKHLADSKEDGDAPRIVTGRDTRESGPWIEQALITGAIESGAKCESAGIITTPGVAYLAHVENADAGVVISASHNPFRDNGIKIFSPSRRKLDDTTERQIEADVASSATRANIARFGENAELERKVEEATNHAQSSALQARYLDHLRVDVADDLKLNGVCIVLDCANGAASEIAPTLFESLGADVTAINAYPNGRNINLNCGSLHIEELQKRVKDTEANIGVAFDGDADRALFVDQHGQFVDGDATMWVMANHLLAQGRLANKTVVATSMSNLGLEVALRSRGINLVRVDVGDKYVLEELMRSGASLGGEQSGHIIFPDLSLAGDGILTTICLLKAMRDANASLDDLVAGFRRYPQILINVRVREKRRFEDVPEIQKAALQTQQQLGDRGRLVLRYSGTEPLARVMIEGERQEVIESQANHLADVIKEALGSG